MPDRIVIGTLLVGAAAITGYLWLIARFFGDCDEELQSDFESITERNKKDE